MRSVTYRFKLKKLWVVFIGPVHGRTDKRGYEILRGNGHLNFGSELVNKKATRICRFIVN